MSCIKPGIGRVPGDQEALGDREPSGAGVFPRDRESQEGSGILEMCPGNPGVLGKRGTGVPVDRREVPGKRGCLGS